MTKEYFDALEALKTAENHFDNADPEYIDTAILELNAAQKRVAAVVSREKTNGGTIAVC